MIRQLFGRQYSRLGEERIIQSLIKELTPSNRFVIEIGAGDGVRMSNTYRCFKSGYPGVAIEADANKFARLKKNYQKLPKVHLVQDHVTPENIGTVLSGATTPADPLLLNIDIDSCDWFVLQSVLQTCSPTIVVSEINEVIPPPVKFKVLPRENFEWAGGHFFGYSMACLEELMDEFGYVIYALHFNNVILLKSDRWKGPSLSIEAAYQQGYVNKPGRKRKFRYNRKLEHLQHLVSGEVVGELEALFSNHRGDYHLTEG